MECSLKVLRTLYCEGKFNVHRLWAVFQSDRWWSGGKKFRGADMKIKRGDLIRAKVRRKQLYGGELSLLLKLRGLFLFSRNVGNNDKYD